MNIARLTAIRKGLKVERLHTVPHIQPYNNGFHSAGAAIISMELCKLNEMTSGDVIRYMLLHDVSEYRTGDVPADVKVENPELKLALAVAEEDYEKSIDLELPELTDRQHDICRIADLAELGLYCVDEIRMGNTEVYHVLKNVVSYLNTMKFLQYKGVRELKSRLVHAVNHGG